MKTAGRIKGAELDDGLDRVWRDLSALAGENAELKANLDLMRRSLHALANEVRRLGEAETARALGESVERTESVRRH
jgi:hypothetical protein